MRQDGHVLLICKIRGSLTNEKVGRDPFETKRFRGVVEDQAS